VDSITVAVDLAKSVFEVAVSDRPGHVRERRRLSRSRFMPFFAELRPATVLLEACGSSHHWGRRLENLGHTVVLLPPQYVRPYVGRNKTDRCDAKGLLEAFRNEEIHPVPVKSIDQQTITALHRLRSGWFVTRTARINALRGLLREFGIVIPVGSRHVVPGFRALVENPDSALPNSLQHALNQAADDIEAIEARIRTVEHELEALAEQTPEVKRLMAIPGIGLLTATALVAIVGDARRFPSGRHFASFIGLTPREHSSGSVRRLGRISKKGDSYLRMLLIHGARSALLGARRTAEPDRLRRWGLHLEETHGHNKAAVALANKLARIAWAVWVHGRDFARIEDAA
jgi:transposase